MDKKNSRCLFTLLPPPYLPSGSPSTDITGGQTGALPGGGKRSEAVKALVLGIGNTLLGDEGAGVHAVRALQASQPPRPGVEFMDGGTLSFSLATAIEESDHLIVIDAAEMGDRPGTVRLFANEEMDRFLGSNRRHSVHEVGLLDLVALAHLAGRLPRQRALIGIQPQQLDWSETTSAAVTLAIPAACAIAIDLVRGWQP